MTAASFEGVPPLPPQAATASADASARVTVVDRRRRAMQADDTSAGWMLKTGYRIKN